MPTFSFLYSPFTVTRFFMDTEKKKFYLQVEPSDKIHFTKEPESGQIKATLTIMNKSDTRQAYKVKCTRNDLFKIRPSVGLLDYKQNAIIEIVCLLKDGEEMEPDRHHFGIYHIPAPEGCTCEGAWQEHYGPPQGELRVKVVFDP
ncbi:unnamed protein product, partial [Mesorhabditis belari]|uniref:Major sperm protein n=1 Tax=Mesorhabditis belari TaxID=2138241 RepID=A0AAF3J7U5_9BILA